MLDSELRQETDDVVRMHGEVLRRLGQEGIGGVAELAERFEQVRRATQSLSADELTVAVQRVSRLLERLRGTREQLHDLSEMLNAMGTGGPGSDASSDPQEALD